MALVEIEESQLGAYQKVTEELNRLLNNPKTRRMVLQAKKTLDPDAMIPELDAAEPLRQEQSALAEKIDQMQKRLEEAEEKRAERERLTELSKTWESGRNKLRASGYTDEGLANVEKFMEEKGVADHEVAAAAFERLHPPVEPVRSVGGNRFDLFSADDRSSDHMKALLGNPDDPMALDAIINDTLRQVRGR
jgi:hypothetical protein